MEDNIRDKFLEAIAGSLPEHKIILGWIEGGGVSDLVDRLIEILIAELNKVN